MALPQAQRVPAPKNTPVRRAWHPVALLLVLALWLSTVGNLPFWTTVAKLPEIQGARGLGGLASLWLILLCLTLAFLALTLWPRVRKPLGVLLLVTAASSSYFMLTYGVVIDSTMMANMAQTDVREVRDLLSWTLLGVLLVGVVLPGIWWWRQPVRSVGRGATALQHLSLTVVALVATGVIGWMSFQTLSSLMRNHKPLRYMVNPFNTVYATGRLAVGTTAQAQQPLQAIGQDATLASTHAANGGAGPLIVLVVGETARAANFGLSGYARDTTVRLRQLQQAGELVYYPDVTSCGTSTQVSLPCMFSHQGSEAHLAGKGRFENLLDVLQRAGLGVVWIDNQSGCKGVCDRVQSADTRALTDPALCPQGECFDEIMLKVLPEQLAALPPDAARRGTVVVLHQMGSHGPAYFKRTPAALKAYTPECVSNALPDCTPAQIVNAYDNSIRYTDHFLAETVQWLRQQARPTALLYVSDHGESLGENGLYLHGMPMSMAPREQTHVPMVTWLSPALLKARQWNMDCVRARASESLSHDHLFHSMLGLAQVQTALHQPRLDLFSGCGKQQGAGPESAAAPAAATASAASATAR